MHINSIKAGLEVVENLSIHRIERIEKCENDKSQMSDLNQSLCLVLTNHTHISENNKSISEIR